MSPSDPGTVCILVLDDEPAVCRSFARLDLGPAMALVTCSTIAEAETLLAQRQVDVALVDHVLGPGETGLHFLDRLRERDPDCFRIIFTGAADLDFAVLAINRGAIDAFLPKPWGDDQALALLHQGVEACLLRRHNRALLDELSQRNTDLLSFTANLEKLVQDRTTEVRDAHERLKQQQQAMIRLETHGVLNHLARGLAHELNNPLAVILGYAQRLRRMDADPDRLRRLDVILNEVDRCQQLVDQLRRIAAPLDEEPVGVDPAVILAEAAKTLADAGRPVPVIRSEQLVHPVKAAPQALRRVFEEILRNAHHAGASVVQAISEVRPGRVVLSLANDGVTPTEAETRNATKPFFTTHPADGARGLGLSVAAGLLRDQEGHLELTVKPGGGAEIRVQLPPAPADQPLANRRSRHGPGLVLVVDAEPITTELLSDVVRETGREVRTVATCADVRALVRASESLIPVSAVLMERQLPDGDGASLIDDLVAAAPQLAGRIALMIGDTGEPAGHTHGLPVLLKPFRYDQVAKLLEQLDR